MAHVKVKEKERPINEIVQRIDLSDEAKALYQPDLTPRIYLDVLLENEHYDDALKVPAFWLQKKEAVWWGCMCIWERRRPEPPPEISTLIEAIVKWLQNPDEPNRRAIESAAQAAGTDTAAGALGMAAFWSEGSMNPENLPELEPPPDLTAKTVAAAVLFAGIDGPPEEENKRYQQFVHLAFEVQEGKNRWL